MIISRLGLNADLTKTELRYYKIDDETVNKIMGIILLYIRAFNINVLKMMIYYLNKKCDSVKFLGMIIDNPEEEFENMDLINLWLEKRFFDKRKDYLEGFEYLLSLTEWVISSLSEGKRERVYEMYNKIHIS